MTRKGRPVAGSQRTMPNSATHAARLLTALSLILVTAGCAFDGNDTVTIKRDTYGVPHVYADDVYGLFYGYGFGLANSARWHFQIQHTIVALSLNFLRRLKQNLCNIQNFRG